MMPTDTNCSCIFCGWIGPSSETETILDVERCPECYSVVEVECDEPLIVLSCDPLAETS